MKKEIPTVYDHLANEGSIYDKWLAAKAFAALPDEREKTYVIMMPLPNVTGALHMGHAMDNVMQDLLIRWHRMMGDNTLWMPGTDHAGIATQAVVEKRLFELEGKTRHDVGREALVKRIWDWKDQYQQRIVKQQQQMGCSCDWDRQRFTMDDVCSAAVRETFYRMFKDGLIYRGYRLVNWDCHLQTSVSDDEIIHEMVQGHFWYLRYPIIEPQPGEPAHVVVATTRPETMLGDTAVACHPDPEGALNAEIVKLKDRREKASSKDKSALDAEIERIEKRKKTHLPLLRQFVEMARAGRTIRLPLVNREIPLILDEWAKPEKGTGCVKITPAHDFNDYEVWQRHQNEIQIINIFNPDGSINANGGTAYDGIDRVEARKKVVTDFEALGLLESIEDHEVEIGHSDRSKTPIEPYLSKQWFIKMDDLPDGVVLGRGTDKEFTATGLAQAAMDAVKGDWVSATGRKLTFYPDPVRYGDTYYNWLAEKRDWCISRQLWWGHRIPIWKAEFNSQALLDFYEKFNEPEGDVMWFWVSDRLGREMSCDEAREMARNGYTGLFEVKVCVRDRETEAAQAASLEELGLAQDSDVLDTWFSSALWPHSTLGWPDPDKAKINPGQTPTAGIDGRPNTLDYYYPGSCLVTGRDIITLWVARMVITGLYNLGDVPFTDCFIHANILDGKGERMSKSKGNGIDPVDIIERYGTDAMRYELSDMQTGTQDIRLPVQAISPFTGSLVDLATAKHGRSIFTYICPESGKEFDVLGTMDDLPAAKIISERFEVGKNFCNKLWNAARFALMNLEEQDFKPLAKEDLPAEDRWILSRLAKAVKKTTEQFYAYNPSAALGTTRDFFWSEFCDEYIELVKPRLKNDDHAFQARQTLAFVLDQVIRLFHPVIPFITEAIWAELNAIMPQRGITELASTPELIATAAWPEAMIEFEDAELETQFELMFEVITGIRNVRSKYNVNPGKKVAAHIKTSVVSQEKLSGLESLISHRAGLDKLAMGDAIERPKLSAIQVVGDLEIYLEGVLDPEKERERLHAQKIKLIGFIQGLDKKLANENFTSRAPAEVVEAERKKLTEAKQQLALIEDNLLTLA